MDNTCISYFRIVIDAIPWIKARAWFKKNEPSYYILFLETLHLIPLQLNIGSLHPNITHMFSVVTGVNSGNNAKRVRFCIEHPLVERDH